MMTQEAMHLLIHRQSGDAPIRFVPIQISSALEPMGAGPQPYAPMPPVAFIVCSNFGARLLCSFFRFLRNSSMSRKVWEGVEVALRQQAPYNAHYHHVLQTHSTRPTRVGCGTGLYPIRRPCLCKCAPRAMKALVLGSSSDRCGDTSAAGLVAATGTQCLFMELTSARPKPGPSSSSPGVVGSWSVAPLEHSPLPSGSWASLGLFVGLAWCSA